MFIALLAVSNPNQAMAQGVDTSQTQELPSSPNAEIVKVTASNPTVAAQFGTSVAFDGDTAIIGAPGERNASGVFQGAAYIFVRNGNGWTQQARLGLPSGAVGGQFGISVAISGDTAIVGANYEQIGSNGNQGAAYVYVRSGTNWTFEQKLTASDGLSNSQFGYSVALQGNTAVIGAPRHRISNVDRGVAYVFTRTGTTWAQQIGLSDSGGVFGDGFGWSVAIDEGTIVIGALYADGTAPVTNQGVVCIFTGSGAFWNQQARLSHSDADGADRFGTSVAIDGNTLIVGANSKINGQSTGAAYIFTGSGANWTEQQKFMPLNSTRDFGYSVGISGDNAIVGAIRERVGTNDSQGAAHIYVRTGNVWIPRGRLVASDGRVADSFGFSVAVSGNKFVVGSPEDDEEIATQGSAYFYIAPPAPPDLQAGSDSGISSSDNITKLRNVSFDVNGITSGATVQLIRSGVIVSSQVVNGNSVTLTDDNAPADGPYYYFSRQIVNGEFSSTSEETIVTFDTTLPVVAVNQHQFQSDPTSNTGVGYRIDVSEPVVGLDAADISFVGSTANVSAATVSVIPEDPLIYSLNVNNIVGDNQTVIASIPAGSISDVAGNLNSNSVATDNTVTVDNVRPSVTINQAVNQIDPTANLPISFTVVFSEPVTGFNNNFDVSLNGSTANVSGATINITGSGTTYNVAVSNFTSNGQFVRIIVQPGAAADSLGNSNVPSTSSDNTVTVDNVRPTVTVNQAATQADPTSTQPVNFTVVFSEAVTNFDAADISLAGSTANVSSAMVTVTGSGATYNVAIGGISSSGQIRASVAANGAQDAFGNLSNSSTSTDNTINFNSRRAAFDFDGDGKSDLSVFRPDNGTWYLQQSTAGFTGIGFGLSTDKIVPADYDGDGKADVAVYRDGTWYLQRSSQGFVGVVFGDAADIPQPADFDGDGRAELAVFRPSNGTWYVFNLATNQFNAVLFGASTDKPVVADYDGDGRADYAVFRNGVWYVQRSSLGFTGVAFGEATDKPVVGDYDGDGKSDIAVFRPSTGVWYLLRSTQGFTGVTFGLGTDVPAPADFDGDGKTDIAVFREGAWYLQRSTQGFTGAVFGAATDKPVPSAFVP